MPSPSSARHGPRRHVTLKSARIEQKLDDLVSLLRSQCSPKEFRKGDNNGASSPNSENDELEFEEDTFTPPTNVTSDLSVAVSEVYFDEPSPTEADESLRRYREDMIVRFKVFLHCNGSRRKICANSRALGSLSLRICLSHLI